MKRFLFIFFAIISIFVIFSITYFKLKTDLLLYIKGKVENKFLIHVKLETIKINLLPLSIESFNTEIKPFHKSKMIISSPRIKILLNPFRIIGRNNIITGITISNPEIIIDPKERKFIINLLNRIKPKKRGNPIDIRIINGRINILNYLSLKGIEVIVSNGRVHFISENGFIKYKNIKKIISRLYGDIKIEKGIIKINKFKLYTPKEWILISGNVYKGLNADINFSSMVDVKLINELFPKLIKFGGKGYIAGNIYRDNRDFRAKGNIKILNGNINGYLFRKLSTDFYIGKRRISINNVIMVGTNGSIKGDIDYKNKLLNGEFKIKGINISKFFKDLNLPYHSFNGIIDGSLSFKGYPGSSIEGKVNVFVDKFLLLMRNNSAIDLKRCNINMDFELNKEGLIIKSGNIISEAIENSFSGAIYKKGKVYLSINSNIVDPRVMPSTITKYLNPFSLKGIIEYKNGVISSGGILFISGNSSLLISGYGCRDNININIDRIEGNIRDIITLPNINGDFKGSIRLHGKINRLKGNISLSFSSLNIFNESIDKIYLKSFFDDKKLIFKNFIINKGKAKIKGSGYIDIKKGVYIHLKSDGLTLQGINYIRRKRILAKGGILFNGDIVGMFNDIRLNGSIRSNEIMYNKSNINNLKIDISMKLKDNFPFNMKGEFGNINIDRSGIELNASGVVTLYGILKNIRSSVGKAYIKNLSIKKKKFYIKNVNYVVIDYKDNSISIHRTKFNGIKSNFSIGGNLRNFNYIDIDINGNINLNFLNVIDPDINGYGMGVLKGKVKGNVKKPSISGRFDVKNGVFKIKKFPYNITNIDALILFNKDKIIFNSFEGVVGGGKIIGEGYISLAGIIYNLRAKFNNVEIKYPPWLPSRIHGELALVGDKLSPLLRGDITVEKAIYSKRLNLRDIIKKINKRSHKIKKGKKGKITFNINIDLDSIIVSTNVGKGELKGGLKISGNPPDINLLGNINVLKGSIFFRENEFNIISGSVDFRDPLRVNPVFEITGDAKIRNYYITLNISGTIKKYNIVLRSDPVLSESDIISLLSLGGTREELKESGLGVIGVTSLVTGKMEKRIEKRIKRIFGFDTFEISPHSSRNPDVSGSILTIGKELNPKTRVKFSRSLESPVSQDVEVEYNLSKNLSILGDWNDRGGGSRGSFGGDIKFRWEFK